MPTGARYAAPPHWRSRRGSGIKGCAYAAKAVKDQTIQGVINMEADRVRRLAEHMETVSDDRFDMRGGTMAWFARLDAVKGGLAEHCIALFRVQAHYMRRRYPGCANSPALVAGRILGLSARQSGDLFQALSRGGRITDVTRQEAIDTLRHLEKTGEVLWSIQFGEATASG